MRIGILTGGGDVPGLNPCIKTVVNRAEDAGMTVTGIRHGWGGLLNYNPDDPEGSASCIEPLTKRDVRTIDRYGGTHLHTSRTNPARVKEDAMPEFLKGAFEFKGEKKTADCTAARPARARAPGHRRARADRRRRHALLRGAAAPGRRPRPRHPEDDGQRRLRHRLLHRLLDRGHPQRRVRSTRCAPRRARTSASRSSSCSAATRARRRSSRPTSPTSSARSSPRCPSTSSGWPG